MHGLNLAYNNSYSCSLNAYSYIIGKAADKMATESSSLVATKSSLPQLPEGSEMVMTTDWIKRPVTMGPDPGELDVPSANDELPIQQTTFSAGELVTGQATHHFKM